MEREETKFSIPSLSCSDIMLWTFIYHTQLCNLARRVQYCTLCFPSKDRRPVDMHRSA